MVSLNSAPCASSVPDLVAVFHHSTSSLGAGPHAESCDSSSCIIESEVGVREPDTESKYFYYPHCSEEKTEVKKG